MKKNKINIYIYLLMFLLGLYLSSYQNYNQYIAEAYSLEESGIGLLINLHFIGSLLFPIILGKFADMSSKKFIMKIVFVVFACGLALILMTKSALVLSVSIFLIGGSFATLEGLGTGILADNNQHSDRAINSSQASFCLGAAIGPIVSQMIYRATHQFKTIYLIFLIIIVGLLFFNNRLHYREVPYVSESRVKHKPIVKSKLLWIMILVMFIYVGIEEGYAFWTTTLIKQQTNQSRIGYVALSLFWTAMGLGRVLASKMKKNLLLYSLIGTIMTIPISVLIVHRNLKTAESLIAFALVGLAYAPLWPAIMSATANKFYNQTGTALGYMMSASALGGATIPCLMGIAAEAHTMKSTFLIILIAGIALVIILIGLLYRMKSQRQSMVQTRSSKSWDI